ncbi:MAG: chromosome partitioning protein, partial [Candidatus Midichloriaceae bacterium]
YGKKDIDDIDKLIGDLKSKHDFIIIDTPGNDNILNRHLHYVADTVISPINDSFIDVDLLGKVSPDDYKKGVPGVYTAMVWEQKKNKAFKDKKELRWIVVRNRLSFTDAINKRNIAVALNALRKRFGFEVSPGFSDRVIFKELFLNGLTLLDIKESKGLIKMNPSMISARQELRDFVYSLNLNEIKKEV